MAGHSKWANIKHRKGRQDAARSKEFQKIVKELYVAAKTGDPDPNNNPLLRLAIAKAKAANMPNDRINNAISKAQAKDSEDLFEIRYEGYGPGGVAIMVDCLTDNKNRTASKVRAAFTKYGGNLGTDGSVSYLFKRVGVLIIPNAYDEDEIFEMALNAGANDLTLEDNQYIIETNDNTFLKVKENLEQEGITDFRVAEVTYLPTSTIVTESEQLDNLINTLEDLDDVNNVYHNLD